MVELWEIAGWMKTGAKGPYMSLKGQEPRERDENKPAERLDGKRAGTRNEDIPF